MRFHGTQRTAGQDFCLESRPQDGDVGSLEQSTLSSLGPVVAAASVAELVSTSAGK